jgi:hypothetical protein
VRWSRVPATTRLPWKRPRFEWLLLALVAVATLLVVYPVGAQDTSRLCLTEALGSGRLSADECLAGTVDRSRHNGHLYSNKAPGISALAIPATSAVRLKPAALNRGGDHRLWAVRLATSGLLLLVGAFLVGRVAEGLAPGWGGATLVTFALGTLISPLGPTLFDHVATATLGFAAFVLAWARRELAAGLVVGLALLVEYQAAAILLAVGGYVVLRGGKPFVRYLLGVVPGAVLLGAYGWAAFGAPWRNPLSFSDNQFEPEHHSGLLGIHAPYAHAVRLVFVGDRGLLVVSPVLAAAAAGLWVVWRAGHRAEAVVCVAVTAVFAVASSGYFVPYGGDSPGPRFFVPALPFLCVGLAPAFRRAPVVVAALAAASVVASTAIALTWPSAVNSAVGYRGSVWARLGELVEHGSKSQIATWAQKTALEPARVGRLGSAALVLGVALLALGIGLWDGWATGRDAPAS